MAWLSGLAGKAEHLLNKIDKNTAAVLSKEKHDIEPQPLLTDVTWIPSNEGTIENTTSTPKLESPQHFPRVSPAHLESFTPTKSNVDEEELIMLLNAPTETPKKTINIVTEPMVLPASPSSIVVEHPTDNSTDSISELSVQSDRSSPSPLHTSVIVPDNDFIESSLNGDCELDLQKENLSLRHDVQRLCADLSLVTERKNLIENERNELLRQFDVLRQEYEHKFEQQRIEVDQLIRSSKDGDLKNHLKTAQRDLEQKDELLDKQQTDHQKEINVLKEKLQLLDIERTKSLKQMSDLQSILERSRSELNSTRSELEQHRARALKTLQEKEKLISELRGNATAGLDDTTIMELNQLRQEREALREENQQVCEQLRLTREELNNADIKLEKIIQRTSKANAQAQELVAVERRCRLEAEEDVKHHSEEIRSLKEELTRQHNSMSLKLQKQESEISRLRSQLSAATTPSSEVESRLATLTQTLVLKQQALEHLTTERNALRLQLEKVEHEYRNISRKNILYNNVNDTDDAKAQVPTFLIETPFDTGVARRVKRAYSSLDAVSVRTGVFLRRYPLARILVLFYMVLLHFWVLVVLLSRSPE